MSRSLLIRWLLLAAVVAAIVAIILVSRRDDSLIAPPNPSNIDVATPEMVSLKADSGIEECPAPQVADGGLPALTLPCLGGGREVDLSTLRGPLILNLWWQGCVPCAKEMPVLQEFHERFGDRVPIIGIDHQDTYPGVALKQVIRRGVTYPQLADPDGDVQGTDLTVTNYPQFYFLSADGELSTAKGGIDSLDQMLAMVRDHLGIELS